MFIMLMNIAMMLADCVLLPRRLQYSNILMMKMIMESEYNGDDYDDDNDHAHERFDYDDNADSNDDKDKDNAYYDDYYTWHKYQAAKYSHV